MGGTDRNQSEGRDEMNLAEFPLSAISDRLNADQTSIVFEDRVFDRNKGETVTRQLQITASAEYGLPTSHDDEVILGLLQLSRLQGFADRRVGFTRYQLIQLLGWRNEGRSYERIERSLNRWLGVTLYYKNAWWDKARQSWVDEKFHILDNVTLYGRERGPKGSQLQGTLAISCFTWNDTVFRSFQAGNLKSIDFELFKRLESAVAKRLFRFLDKRFYHSKRWEFNLQVLGWEHIGLARSYDSANLKRRLRPAIAELERHGFIQACPDSERFKRLNSGEWRVVFEDGRKGPPKRVQAASLNDVLEQALIERGVTATAAQETVRAFPKDRVQQQIEVFDWLVDRKDPRVERNPAGYLVSAIRSEYTAPREFVARVDDEQRKARRIEAERKREEKLLREKEEAERKRLAVEMAITEFWQSLSPDERSRSEGDALLQANAFEKSLLGQGGSLATATRKKLLDAYALQRIEAGG